MSAALRKLNDRITEVNSLLCVGLDSNADRLPPAFQQTTHPQFAFNQHIIEQTHEYAAAFKLNTAFYEVRGAAGWTDLALTIRYLQENHPDILTVCDAKRADIGSTSEAYARAILDELGFDAITLQPYLGRDALEPFLQRTDKLSIILCRTSNAGAGEIQDVEVDDGKPLWHLVAERVHRDWNENKNCMLVVGATYPREMAHIRAIVDEMPLLVPGIGVQGGNVAQTVSAGKDQHGRGLLINSSRGIIFSEEPARSASELRDAINQFR